MGGTRSIGSFRTALIPPPLREIVICARPGRDPFHRVLSGPHRYHPALCRYFRMDPRDWIPPTRNVLLVRRLTSTRALTH